jgi:4-hydroxythreonine-4-phosphate dehydrogenase
MPSKRKKRSVLAVTIGDPAGVGPEIVGRFFESFRPRGSTALIIGALPVLERVLSGVRRRVLDEKALENSELEAGRGLWVLDSGCRARYALGRDSRGGGSHAGSAVDLACRLAGRGIVQGLVTAPISKNSLNLAGYRFAGHTEMLARYFDAPDCQMMMVHQRLRVVPLTRHLPIKQVSRALTEDRIVACLAVVDEALRRQFRIEKPRIAVSGLNPHAGESGVLGREEIEVIQPALRRARKRRIDATGPWPADAMFQDAGSGTFDALIAMYHDQGLIPFKLVAKRRGVNVTVGLPIVRTSVDHGVAYDIVGTGAASLTSLGAAYRLAEKLAGRGKMSAA